MVYFRTKTIKGKPYWYLQESYRIGKTVRTRHIAYIGAVKPKVSPQDYLKQISKIPQQQQVIVLGTTSRQEAVIEQMFREEAIAVWRNRELIGKVQVDVKFRNQRPVMSITYVGDPYAIGDTLVRVPKKVTLYVKKGMSVTPAELRATVRHESLHLGYPRHDRNFKYVAKKHNAPMSFRDVKKDPIVVQVKQGHRYRTVKEFDNLPDAEKHMDKLGDKDPKTRMRILY